MGLDTKNIQSQLKLGPTPVAVRDSRKCFGRVIFHQVIKSYSIAKRTCRCAYSVFVQLVVLLAGHLAPARILGMEISYWSSRL